jgi:hypothetical protein
MGKRGPKPVDVGSLNVWEFEFYKAFHLLRDGMTLPASNLPPPALQPSELRMIIKRLKQMSPEEYWRTSRQMARDLGEKVNLKRPPRLVDRWWAEQKLAQEISELEEALSPPSVLAQARRRKIWKDLIHAGTHATLRKACGRWARLPDVRYAGMTTFPENILANTAQFLAMKRNKRFPSSDYADNARLDYLARGMAGVMVGVSPMTANERLRNMQHTDGGPLWVESEQRCDCWRCSLQSSNEVSKETQGWYENGFRRFIEVADRLKRLKK